MLEGVNACQAGDLPDGEGGERTWQVYDVCTPPAPVAAPSWLAGRLVATRPREPDAVDGRRARHRRGQSARRPARHGERGAQPRARARLGKRAAPPRA